MIPSPHSFFRLARIPGNVAQALQPVPVASYTYATFGRATNATVETDNYPSPPVQTDNYPSLQSTYYHDAFGNTTAQSGTLASDFPFRFSTKYYDTETGLYYYGDRYYSPTLGRFISEDPIGERGGLNLYGFCGNDPINRWDYLGMKYKLFLTFDDGPISGTEELLNDLKATSVTATFFVNGNNFSEVKLDGTGHMGAGQIEKHIGYLKRMIDEGHLLGSHSYWHKKNYKDPEWMFNDFIHNAREIEKVLGKPLPSTFYQYIRLPGRNTWRVGDINKDDPVTKDTEKTADLLKNAKIFGWDIEWGPSVDAQTMAKNTLKKFESGSGSKPEKLILLAHDAQFNGKAGILEKYINAMKECATFHKLDSY